MIARADVVMAARGWLGTRWHHGASLKGVGTDCVGLILGVAKDLGIGLELSSEYHGYGRQPDGKLLRQGTAEYLDPTSNPGLGDIYLMRFEQDPQHFAIISSPIHIIHAYMLPRKVVENRLDDVWSKRIVSAHRFRGVEWHP